MKLEGKHVLVVGLGVSGKSCVRFFLKAGAGVTAVDHRADALPEAEKNALESDGIRVVLGRIPEELFVRSDMLVLSPGVPVTLPAVKKAIAAGIPVVGEMELAFRYLRVPVVAVTGTNGKTTVTTLIGRMLAASGKRVFVGGNIGTPLVDLVPGQNGVDLAVVEVSSFQLDTIERFRPHVAVLLNVAEDHLDRYPDYAAYCRSKARIFENQTALDAAVYNGGSPLVRAMAAQSPAGKKLPFYPAGAGAGVVSGAEIDESAIALYLDGAVHRLDLSRIRLLGAHNRENIAAAALATLCAGGSIDAVASCVESFEGLPHRLSPVAAINGVRYVNDSKATNVDAVKRALECFTDPVVLILGGRDKNSDFSPLATGIQKGVRQLVLMGEAGRTIASALSGAAPMVFAGDMEEAVRLAAEAARSGDVVLLSPACASFDRYPSYKARGMDFCRAVGKMR